MNTLETLLSREKHLEDALNKVRAEIRQLKVAAAAAAGIAVGDIVTHRGREYKIESIDTSWRGKPWIRGFKKLKTGEWSGVSTKLYGEWTAGVKALRECGDSNG